MNETTKLNSFKAIAGFLKKIIDENKKVKNALDAYILNYLNEHNIQAIKVDSTPEFTDDDNSLKTFLRRAVYDFIKSKIDEDKKEKKEEKPKSVFAGVELAPLKNNSFEVRFNLEYGEVNTPLKFLKAGTAREILDHCTNKDNHIKSTNEDFWKTMANNLFTFVYPDANQEEQTSNIIPLALIINSEDLPSEEYMEILCPFIYTKEENFTGENNSFSDDKIYRFLSKIPWDYVETFLKDKNFVEALGGAERLAGLLDMKTLEQKENKDARELAIKLHKQCKKIVWKNVKTTNVTNNEKIENGDDVENTGLKIIDDEEYKSEVKSLFIIYQLPKSAASAVVFLFGLGLLLAAGFAWSVPFLLGIGFIIPSIVAFVNSILCMKPTQTRTWLAKIFKNCAWIIDGAFLITLGAVFCAGPLAAAFITFGSLSILMGCSNAFVGTLNSMWDTQRELGNPALVNREEKDGGVCSIKYIKSEILLHKIFTLVGFAAACAAGILLALNPAILPIALPFLPAVGIGIAVLSGLGVIKSALRLFYHDSDWQVRFYHAAKYIKAGMFVLGGLALIALPFLPIAAALASIIGMPTLIVNIFSFLVGLISFIKGCMSFTRKSLNIKFLLANQAMEKTDNINFPETPIDIESWKDNVYVNAPSEPLLKTDDISSQTVSNIFEQPEE